MLCRMALRPPEGMRKTVAAFVLLTALVLSLVALWEKLAPGSDLGCGDTTCRVVQHSSFSEVQGLPLPLGAVLLLTLSLIALLKGRLEITTVSLALVAGAETYLTGIELFYLKSVCRLCISFYACTVLSLALLSKRAELKRLGAAFSFAFLTAHLVYFFPNAQIRADLLQVPSYPRVEVFATPEQLQGGLLDRLEAVTGSRGAQLVLRPLPGENRKEAVALIASRLFARSSLTALNLSEKVLRANEEAARTCAFLASGLDPFAPHRPPFAVVLDSPQSACSELNIVQLDDGSPDAGIAALTEQLDGLAALHMMEAAHARTPW